MLEKFKYINHLGEVLEFGKFPLFANYNDLRDFSWDVRSTNEKISGFYKGIVSKSIPILIMCSSEEEGIRKRNELFDVFEKDVLFNKPGKIIIGDYYLKCFVTGSTKGDYLISKRYMQLDLSIQTDSPEWVKETTTNFRFASESAEGFLDFPYSFPYDYKNGLSLGELNNSGFIPANFKMVIYGATKNPAVIVGNHIYSVSIEMGKNEYLTIDSIKKTIFLTKSNGEQINLFNSRNKDSYIFEKIPPGVNVVSASNSEIKFDITLLEERSEPKWI